MNLQNNSNGNNNKNMALALGYRNTRTSSVSEPIMFWLSAHVTCAYIRN